MYEDQTLWKHLDGELPAAEAEALEAAAREDAALAERLAHLRAMKEAVLDGAPRPPAGFAERVVARALRPAPPVIDLDDARRFLRRALVAAAVLAAIGLAVLAIEVVPDLLAPDPILADPIR